MAEYYLYNYDWQEFLKWFGKLTEPLKDVLSSDLSLDRDKLWREFIKPENRSDVIEYVYEKQGKFQWFGFKFANWPRIKINRRKVEDKGMTASKAASSAPDIEQIKQDAFQAGQQSVGRTNVLKWLLIIIFAFVVLPAICCFGGQYLLLKSSSCLQQDPGRIQSFWHLTSIFFKCLVF